MIVLSMLLTLGIWAALPVTGYWFFLRHHRPPAISPSPSSTTFALAIVIGLAIWSGPLLATTVLGVHRAEFFGIVGWMVTLVGLFRIDWQREEIRKARPRLEVWDYVLAFGLVLALAMYLGFPTEAILPERDEGMYTNHAIWIAHHGRVDIPYPWPQSIDSVFRDASLRLRGTFQTQPTMSVWFGHLFPTWLASAFSTFGYSGLVRLNGLFTLISLTIFYGICRCILPKPYAVVATLFLALNPSQIWLARVTLSEILTQLFIWTGLLLLVQALRSDIITLARWAGILFALSAFVRIDSLLLVPLLLLSHLVVRLVENPAKRSSHLWLALYQSALPTFTLALAYYIWIASDYFWLHVRPVAYIGVVTLASLIALLLGLTDAGKFAADWITKLPFLVTVSLAAFTLSAYGYWIRPIPRELVPATYPMFDLAQAMSSRSLVNLAAYLSPPLVWMGILGWLMALWVVVRTKRHPYLAPVLVIVGGFALLYLWKPSVNPYHFWAIRRFVPVIVPGFILFASLGTWRIMSRAPRVWRIAFSSAILIFVSVFTVRSDSDLYAFAEEEGFYSQIESLAATLPKDEIILANTLLNQTEWWTALRIAFDRNVVPIDLSTEEGQQAFRAWTKHQLSRQEPVYLLSQREVPLKGLQHSKVGVTHLSRSVSERTLYPLPRSTVRKSSKIFQYEIRGIDEDASYQNVNLVHPLLWGVTESGFYEQRRPRGKPARWTDGAATVRVPLDHQNPPRVLKIRLAQTGLQGTRLRILVNSREVFDQRVPPGAWSKDLALTEMNLGDHATIELLSDTFISRDREQAQRRGVQVRSLILSDRPRTMPRGTN